MDVMFTEKLSKMVATTLQKFVDLISSDMVFETEHLFWQKTSSNSGEKNKQYHGPTIRKKPECNSKRYENSHNEVRAGSRY